MIDSASISPCRQYRYRLSREGKGATTNPGHVLFLMLNPSTADATADDPTIRRCRKFAHQWGYGGGIVVGNLFAYRASKPVKLWEVRSEGVDIVGPHNEEYLRAMFDDASLIVAAWGAGGGGTLQADRVSAMLNRSDRPAYCLGVTANGSPRHPLYVPYSQSLVHFAGNG